VFAISLGLKGHGLEVTLGTCKHDRDSVDFSRSFKAEAPSVLLPLWSFKRGISDPTNGSRFFCCTLSLSRPGESRTHKGHTAASPLQTHTHTHTHKLTKHHTRPHALRTPFLSEHTPATSPAHTAHLGNTYRNTYLQHTEIYHFPERHHDSDKNSSTLTMSCCCPLAQLCLQVSRHCNVVLVGNPYCAKSRHTSGHCTLLDAEI
jgi:hypothetical protein